MKKIVILMILVITMFSLSSEGYYWSNSSISTGNTSTMTVVVEGTSSILNCGISSTFVPTKSDWGLTDVTKKEFDITAKTSSTEWSYKGSISELYVWWQIYSTTTSYNVNISLSPLKSAADTIISYSSSIYYLNSSSVYVLEDDTTFKNISGSTVTKTLCTYTGSSTADIESGHRKLTFVTEDAKEKVFADSFSATLKISVVVTT